MASFQYQTSKQLKTPDRPTAPQPSHALAVGASGMLSGVVKGLAYGGWRVSVVARTAQRLERLAAGHTNIYPLVCNYVDEAAYDAALTVAFAERGAPTLAIVWIHGTAPEAPQHTAQVISRSLSDEQSDGHRRSDERQESGTPAPVPAAVSVPYNPPDRARGICRFFHLHVGSEQETAVLVEHYRRTCSLLSHIAYRAITLGRSTGADTDLSHEQISQEVLAAIQADHTLYRIGSE